MKGLKKSLALALAIVMLVSMGALQAFAQGNTERELVLNSERAGEPADAPAVPDKFGKNITPNLIRIVCDSDANHKPVDSKLLYWRGGPRYVTNSLTWNEELGAWTAEMCIGQTSRIHWNYVYNLFEKTYNGITHEFVPGSPITEDAFTFNVMLKWDPQQQLWVTLDGKPVELHVHCKTAPDAPLQNGLGDYQIRVSGMVNGAEEEQFYMARRGVLTIGEVKGSRQDGFTVDLTVKPEENMAFVEEWMAKYGNGAKYGIDWTKTDKEITFTLKYDGDTTGNFKGKWCLPNGKIYGQVGEIVLGQVHTVNYYPMTEDGTHGDTASASGEVVAGNKVTVLPDVNDAAIGGTRTGYHAVGWYYLDENGQKQVFDENTVVTQDMDVYADFAMDPYHVEFMVDGKVVKTVEKEAGSTLTDEEFPAAPEKVGYTFKGWRTEDGKSVDTEYVVAGNVEAHPVFEANTYALMFMAGEGKVEPDTKYVVYGTAVGELPVPTREGYQFEGWFDASGEQVTEKTIYEVAANWKIFAKWSEVEDPGDNTTPDPTEPETTEPETTKPEETKPEGGSETPKTADHAQIGMLMAAMVLSASVMAVCVMKKYRMIKK